MVSKSSLIGFGLGAALAGGVAYFSLHREPGQAPVTATASAPVSEATATAVPVTELEPLDANAPKRGFARADTARRSAASKSKRFVEEPASKPSGRTPVLAQVQAPEPVTASPAPVPQPVSAAPVSAPAAQPAAPEPAVRKAVPPPPPPPPNKVTVPAGTTLSVRLLDGLHSDRNHTGDSFRATLDQPLVVDDFVLAERGARVEGRVVSATESGRVKGLSDLVLELLSVTTSDGQRVAIQTATYEKHGEKTVKQDAEKVAIGAGVGAALGAIFGGGKGAAIGTAAGGGAGAGTVLMTKGKEVNLPPETRLTFQLKAPVTITERR